MLIFVFFIIGFMIADSTMLGGQVVNGLDWTLYIYWFSAIFVGIISIIFPIAGGVAGSDIGKLGAILGATGGLLLSSILMLIVGIQIYLIYFVMDNINVDATQFADFGEKAQQGIYAIIAIFVINLIRSSSSSSK